jgi:hypothetical protein
MFISSSFELFTLIILEPEKIISRERASRYESAGMLGGPLSWSKIYAEDKNLVHLRDIETRVLLRPGCNLVIMPNETALVVHGHSYRFNEQLQTCWECEILRFLSAEINKLEQ